MTSRRWLVAGAFGVALVSGTLADRPVARPVIELGGYRVLAADFHLHSSTWSDGTLTPFGLVLEAERQGLDAIAITGHNEVVDAKVGRWFSARIGGPMVLVGQEILSPHHHVIALGVEHVVDSTLSVAEQIDDVHAAGGVAIAAHPIRKMWPSFDAAAMSRLDGSEVCHPMVYGDPGTRQEFEAFAARAPMAAIGSSDFHGFGRMGMCRTYVFARDASAASIVEALRAHRTVVYGPDDQVYGDPALVALAEARPELREYATQPIPAGVGDWISRIAGIAGLLGLAWTLRSRA
jgi:hypothetical protein